MPFPQDLEMPANIETTLRVDSLSLPMEEYDYLGANLREAAEARARLFNTYLVKVGIVVSGLGGMLYCLRSFPTRI